MPKPDATGRVARVRDEPVGREAGHSSGATGEANEIVIVGTCASGKSTLVDGLVRLGYPARVVGQEHSDIQRLWQRHNPALVIGLSVSLETVRSRRGRNWSAAVYDRQQRRLQPAMSAAAIILDTQRLSPMATLAAATAAIRAAGIDPVPPST